MAPVNLLETRGLTVAFGGVRALDDVSFALKPNRIHAIIGPNGAGKTTLFNVVSGLYRAGHGAVFLDGEDVTGLAPHHLAARGMSRTFQNLQIFMRMTALANVMVGRHRHERRASLSHLLALPSAQRQNRETEQKAAELLDFVGLSGDTRRPAGALSYGALKRLEIARALASEPRLLLLDEPAAGCNTAEKRDIDRLVRAIAGQGVTVVLVEHDMKLVMGLSDHVLVFDQGRVLAEGKPDAIARDPRVITAYLGAGFEAAPHPNPLPARGEREEKASDRHTGSPPPTRRGED